MASHNFPAWLLDIPATALALCKANAIVPATLPRSYFFGPDPAPVIIAASVVVASDLSDSEWSVLRADFPGQQRKNAADVRRYLSGALYVKASGCRFVNLPPRYGNSQALRKALERWATLGIFQTLLERIENGEFQEKLSPERIRTLLSLCREWSGKGMKYAKARGLPAPAKRDASTLA